MEINYTKLLQFFRQFDKFYNRQFSELMGRTGLSIREIHVLLFLANNPDYDTARDISALRGLSKSQISQAVDLLAAEGLVSRTPDQKDRRIVHLSITPEAAPLVKECRQIQDRCGQQLLSGMTHEQELQLKYLLDLVMDNGARLAEEVL